MTFIGNITAILQHETSPYSFLAAKQETAETHLGRWRKDQRLNKCFLNMKIRCSLKKLIFYTLFFSYKLEVEFQVAADGKVCWKITTVLLLGRCYILHFMLQAFFCRLQLKRSGVSNLRVLMRSSFHQTSTLRSKITMICQLGICMPIK